MTNGDTPGTLVASGSGGLQGIGYVEGYGIGSAVLTISGNVLPGNIVSFGQVASGQSGTQTLTLTNAGAASLTVRGIVSQPPFLSSSTCGSAMAMGVSCTITVTYSPVNQVASGTAASNTIDSGTLTIVSDALTSPNTLLPLRGRVGRCL